MYNLHSNLTEPEHIATYLRNGGVIKRYERDKTITIGLVSDDRCDVVEEIRDEGQFILHSVGD